MLKKVILFIVLAFILSGCSTANFETVGNVDHTGQNSVLPRTIQLSLPPDAAVLTASGTDMLYTCNDYTLSLQTFPAGDLDATVRNLCGFSAADVTLLHSQCDDHRRADWVWVAAGEGGDMLCRAAILDDGNFHYSLCVYAAADEAAELTELWNQLFASFCLEKEQLN